MDSPDFMSGKNPAECRIWGGKDRVLVPESPAWKGFFETHDQLVFTLET